MRTIYFFSLLFVLFRGMTVSAQLPTLHDELSKVRNLGHTGKLVEAYEALVAIELAVSELNPASSLERPYHDADKRFNEFYFKDMALKEVAGLFFIARQIDDAIMTTQEIANRPLRNDQLLSILDAQWRIESSEDLDQRIERAKKIVELLTDLSQDKGYGKIAEKYTSIDRFDLALEFLDKIEDDPSRDEALVATAIVVKDILREKTTANEQMIRTLAALTRSPLVKAKVLRTLLDFYWQYAEPVRRSESVQKLGLIDPADLNKIGEEVLEELEELVFSLSDDKPEKTAQLLYLYRQRSDPRSEQEVKASTIRKAYLENVEKFHSDHHKFRGYELLAFGHREGRPVHDPSLDVELIEKMRPLAEQTEETTTKVDRLTTVLRVACHSTPTGSDERKQAFLAAYEAVSVVDDAVQWPKLLLPIIDLADHEEAKSLLNDVTATLLAHGSEEITASDQRLTLLEWVVSMFAKRDNVDQMLVVAHSQKIPDAWKQRIYERTASELVNVYDDAEFRPDDFQKLFALIESPLRRKIELFNNKRSHAATMPVEWWQERIKEAIEVSDPPERFLTCLSVLEIMHGVQDIDAAPLIDAMEQVASAETLDVNRRASLYRDTLRWSQRYSLWNERKTADWFRKLEEAIDQMPNKANQFRHLRDAFNIVKIPSQDHATQDRRIDKLLVATKHIPVQDGYYFRLYALQYTAEYAIASNLPDRARRIIAETIEFIEMLPEKDRRSVSLDNRLLEIERLRDQLAK